MRAVDGVPKGDCCTGVIKGDGRGGGEVKRGRKLSLRVEIEGVSLLRGCRTGASLPPKKKRETKPKKTKE